MTGTRACPQCGDAIAGDSPEGLCPRCLLQSGFADGAVSTPPSGMTTPHSGTFIPPSPAELARRFPQLEILELLGQGGMGAVYKARQPKLDRLVAVKILPPEWDKDPAFAERFAREAKALAKLTHPHIVAIHDFGESDGLFYLVMEYVDGANLRHLLHDGGLQPAEALAIIPQVCDALQYAHEEGVVHRDIKPENILLDSKGRVKIADFGLAKLLNKPRAAFTLTGSQQVMGTLDYMAPEQRLRPQEVDHRADIYSLGVVFYEMLTGELPLGRFDPPSHKAKIDARLDEVVFRALEREPARRYQRVSQVKVDVESIVTGRRHQPHAAAAGLELAVPPADIDRFALVGPAAGIFLTGLLGILFWTILGIALFAVNMEPRRPSGPEVLLFLLMPALGIPAGLTLMIGSRRMAHAQSYYWAVASAIWAMMPWSPAWLVGLPCGIWGLRVLRQPRVQTVFGVAIRQRNQVIPAAIGLLLAGVVGGLFWMILGFSLFVTSFHPYNRYHDGERVLFLLMIPAGGLAAYILVYGAARMMRLRSYQFAVLASMWACLPWSPAWVIALPFGIWSLRILGRRDIQLAFGLPFQPHASAFEAPLAAIPVATPAPQPPKPTGPVRRGVRNFFGSMYSLMFQSRMENPTPHDPSAPVVAALPADSVPRMREGPLAERPPIAIPVRRMAAVEALPAEPKSRVGLWIACFMGLLAFVIFLGFVASVSDSQHAPKSATLATKQLSILKDRYRDFSTRWPLSYPHKEEAMRIFETTEQEYLALEGRFTKRERKQDGHLTVTVQPFASEVQELDRRFQMNLDAVVQRDIRNREGMGGGKVENSPRYVDQSAFPFGKEEARIEIWRENNWYRGRVFRGQETGKDKPVEEFSGSELPKMYERFWSN